MLINARWNGSVFTPWGRHKEALAEKLKPGVDVELTVEDSGTAKAWAAYHARIRDYHRSMPEGIATERYMKSPNHLRKQVLIICGYYNSHYVNLSTPEEARRMMMFMRPQDEFSIIDVAGNTLTVFQAKSQKKMDPEERKESKAAVLAHLESLLGVTATEARRALSFGG